MRWVWWRRSVEEYVLPYTLAAPRTKILKSHLRRLPESVPPLALIALPSAVIVSHSEQGKKYSEETWIHDVQMSISDVECANDAIERFLDVELYRRSMRRAPARPEVSICG